MFSRRNILKAIPVAFFPVLSQAGRRIHFPMGRPHHQPVRHLKQISNISSPPIEYQSSLELHILNRLGFGPREKDFHLLEALGNSPEQRLKHFVEKQLNPSQIDDSICNLKLKSEGFYTLDLSLKQLWQNHHLKALQLRDELKEEKTSSEKNPDTTQEEIRRLQKDPYLETERATWIRAIYSEKQLQEVMVNFWHDHFNVSVLGNEMIPVVLPHYDREVIRSHVFGNFRELVGAVAKSPAMLVYLDGFLNQSGNPNENYARELFELHTLGAENYLGTQDRSRVAGYSHGKPVGYVDGDVYEAARCFTGWRIANEKNSNNTGSFEYFDQWHDRFQKVVLGHSFKEYSAPMADGEKVLDLVSFHPGTSVFVCRKLCKKFVGENPSDKLVKDAANLFIQTQKQPDQLKQVLRFILLSDEFKMNRSPKLKRPFEFVASLIRVLDGDFHPKKEFIHAYQTLGQPFFQWRTPDGYPDSNNYWMSTSLLMNRWRLANQLLLNHVKGVEFHVDRQTPTHLSNSKDLTEFWIKKVIGKPIPPQSVQSLKNYLDGGGQSFKPHSKQLPTMIALLAMTSEFQWK